MVVSADLDSEHSRLAALRSYRILDSSAEAAFDQLTLVARALFDTPIAYISFVDAERQWMKSTIGLDIREVPRRHSLCARVIANRRTLVIPDTLSDPLFAGNPYVVGEPYIRFYVGTPLLSIEGHALGTLCVVDRNPRTVMTDKISALEALSQQVVAQLELRRANRILAEDRETFLTLFSFSPLPLLLVQNQRVVRANQASQVLTGRDLEGAELKDLFLEERRTYDSTNRLLRSTDDVPIPVMVFETDVQTDRFQYGVMAIYDVRDRVEKEQMLEEARAAAEETARIKDTFLTMVSHDMRSPLSGIFTMLDLLARKEHGFSEVEKQRVYRDLKSSTAMLLEMINQLLNIHRLGAGKIQVERNSILLGDLLTQICLSLQTQIQDKGVHINFDFDPSYELKVDLALTREALFNVLSNAVKFSFFGGQIWIRGAGSVVEIIDNGTGIREEDLPHLFRHDRKTSRVGTADEPGTGLGLPLVHDIMSAHDGHVRIGAAHGGGTRVELDFGVDAALS